MKVLAAVSGGVDSAVGMARAADAGHDVTAVHMALSPDPALTRDGGRGCCTISDANDARRAADKVGVPFYIWDFAEKFRDTVITDFLEEYSAGRTPNPCVRCNEHIKFTALLERARALGFDAVATGHYARLDQTESGPRLSRAVDPGKDQSYVLAVLGTDGLRHSMFPLGDTPKDQVRAEAEARGLRVANKPDSHDICFIPDGDTAGFLRRELGEQPGQIVDDQTGESIGEHRGTHAFTVGQRKGLGVTTATETGRPRYVLRIDPVQREVVVGERERLAVSVMDCEKPVWCGPLIAADQQVRVQIRAHGESISAQVVTVSAESGFQVRLDESLIGVAPGQSCVLYTPDDETVIGQGLIRSAH